MVAISLALMFCGVIAVSLECEVAALSLITLAIGVPYLLA
jgi:hypothetical protein